MHSIASCSGKRTRDHLELEELTDRIVALRQAAAYAEHLLLKKTGSTVAPRYGDSLQVASASIEAVLSGLPLEKAQSDFDQAVANLNEATAAKAAVEARLAVTALPKRSADEAPGMTTWHQAQPATDDSWEQATAYQLNHGGPHQYVCPYITVLEQLASYGKSVHHVAVFVATFNKEPEFMVAESEDTVDRIVPRTIERWLMMMDPQRRDACRNTPLTDINDFTAAIRKQFDKCEPCSVAVILCLDEVLKVEETARKKLLTALAGAVKRDLQLGFPTFGVVTSLHWHPLADAVSKGSNFSLYPVPLRPLWNMKHMQDVVMRGIMANSQLSVKDGSREKAIHAAAVSLGIAGGNPRQWRVIAGHFASLHPSRIGVLKGRWHADSSQVWPLFYLCAHTLVTGMPHATDNTRDSVVQSIIDDSLVQTSTEGTDIAKHWSIPSAWLYSQCSWRLADACLQLTQSLYPSDNELMKAWELGMLAVLYIRAQAYAAYLTFNEMQKPIPFTQYDGTVETDSPITLTMIFAQTKRRDDADPGGVIQTTLLYPWDGEDLSAYVVHPDVLQRRFTVKVPMTVVTTPDATPVASTTALTLDDLEDESAATGGAAHSAVTRIVSPKSRYLSATDLTATEMFVYGGANNEPATEALSTNFCRNSRGEKITLLFHNKLNVITKPGEVHAYVNSMRTFAENTLKLSPATYLSVLFTTGTKGSSCEELEESRDTSNFHLEGIKGAIIVRSRGLLGMLAAVGATRLGDAVDRE